jgi:glyoxylase-like metal-dependent hydrolase (beta-lactamase superfamily II)
VGDRRGPGLPRLAMVNVVFFGAAQWAVVLIDAGLPGMARMITHSSDARFGADRPPAAIILTLGHFDHAGALRTLAERWMCRSTRILGSRRIGRNQRLSEAGSGRGWRSDVAAGTAVSPGAAGRRSMAACVAGGRIGAFHAAMPVVHTSGHSVGHVSLGRQGSAR